MRRSGLASLSAAVPMPTRASTTAKPTVPQRAARSCSTSSADGRIKPTYQSRVKLVDNAFRAVESDPIAVANNPAASSPRRPGASSCTMNHGKTSLPGGRPPGFTSL